ncbi:MAG TPA: hypothetical protein VFI41_09740, partial [Gemmatimonadales bacterium]|nr:hypothetical protein [Gemmatimonadales bacterium]
NKTAQVLAALRGVMGPERFHQGLVEYGRRWIGRHPEPFDFFNTMSQVAGHDLSWFWNSWFERGWSLDQAVDSVTTTGDSVTIVVSDRGLAIMPVRLVVTRADSSVQQVELPASVWLSGARRATTRVAARARVVKVDIDPDGQFPDVDRENNSLKR